MKIGILGAGNVGRTLGRAFELAGHEVTLSTRDSMQNVVDENDVLAWCLPWSATVDALRGLNNLDGKVLIDCTNPIRPDFSGVFLIDGLSAGEVVAKTAPTARVAKAFNTVGVGIMEEARFADGKVSLLVASDDGEAKRVAIQLANDIGFEGVDAGPLSQSVVLESFAWLWISLAVKYGHGRDIAFRLMRR